MSMDNNQGKSFRNEISRVPPGAGHMTAGSTARLVLRRTLHAADFGVLAVRKVALLSGQTDRERMRYSSRR